MDTGVPGDRCRVVMSHCFVGRVALGSAAVYRVNQILPYDVVSANPGLCSHVTVLDSMVTERPELASFEFVKALLRPNPCRKPESTCRSYS